MSHHQTANRWTDYLFFSSQRFTLQVTREELWLFIGATVLLTYPRHLLSRYEGTWSEPAIAAGVESVVILVFLLIFWQALHWIYGNFYYQDRSHTDTIFVAQLLLLKDLIILFYSMFIFIFEGSFSIDEVENNVTVTSYRIGDFHMVLQMVVFFFIVLILGFIIGNRFESRIQRTDSRLLLGWIIAGLLLLVSYLGRSIIWLLLALPTGLIS